MSTLTVAQGQVVQVDGIFHNLMQHKGNFMTEYGGVADYEGTPLYDGNDSTRITFTDNTEKLRAFLLSDESVYNGVKYLYFPTGHYGFSGSKIILDPLTLPYHSIVIKGDGRDLTTLDYIKEGASPDGNTEQGDNALELLRFEEGFKSVIFEDFNAKCTTKTSYVDGTGTFPSGGDKIYAGIIWFCHIKRAIDIILRGMYSERGNYRGISIDGIKDATTPAMTTLHMYDCVGRYTTGSGFWLRGVKKTYGQDCHFYRNGNKGVFETGYGITFSQYCEDIILKNCSAYENYRKGVDKHGGVGHITLQDCLIADNIIFQMSFDHQYVGLYAGTERTDMEMFNVNVMFGRNAAFCNEALAALPLTDRNHIGILLNDKLINGTPAGKLRRVLLNNCSLTTLTGVTEKFYSYQGIVTEAEETTFNNQFMDLRTLQVDAAGNRDVYRLGAISCSRNSGTVVIKDGNYSSFDGACTDLNGAASNSMFFGAQTSQRWVMDGAQFDLWNVALFVSTASGRAFPYAGTRKIDDCSFRMRDMKTTTHMTGHGDLMTVFGTGFFFADTASLLNYGGSIRIGFGDCNSMFEHKFGTSSEGAKFTISGTRLQTATPLKIITGNLYGNISLTCMGRSVSHGKTLAVRWNGSANTFQVSENNTGDLASATMTDYNLKWAGADTNFKCKLITITTSRNYAITEMFEAEIVGSYNDTIKYLGIVP